MFDVKSGDRFKRKVERTKRFVSFNCLNMQVFIPKSAKYNIELASFKTTATVIISLYSLHLFVVVYFPPHFL